MAEIVDIASYNAIYKEDFHMEEKKDQKGKKNSKFQVSIEKQDVNLDSCTCLNVEKELKRKKKKGNDKLSIEVPLDDEDDIIAEKKKKVKGEQENLSHLGTSFTELFITDVVDLKDDDKRKIVDKTGQDTKLSGSLVSYPVKKKKNKRAVLPEWVAHQPGITSE
ncbi:hypothetical protein CRYUN_Cryun05aG0024200 [Craigia yunnanensis]